MLKTWSSGRTYFARVHVAVQAEAHLHRLCLEGERHVVHAAVTGGAANAFLDVDVVFEVHETG